MFKSSTINVCKFCKEKLKSGTLCPNCRTKEQREKKIHEQIDIENENFKNGRKIPDTLFGYKREALLNLYNIQI